MTKKFFFDLLPFLWLLKEIFLPSRLVGRSNEQEQNKIEPKSNLDWSRILGCSSNFVEELVEAECTVFFSRLVSRSKQIQRTEIEWKIKPSCFYSSLLIPREGTFFLQDVEEIVLLMFLALHSESVHDNVLRKELVLNEDNYLYWWLLMSIYTKWRGANEGVRRGMIILIDQLINYT